MTGRLVSHVLHHLQLTLSQKPVLFLSVQNIRGVDVLHARMDGCWSKDSASEEILTVYPTLLKETAKPVLKTSCYLVLNASATFLTVPNFHWTITLVWNVNLVTTSTTTNANK